MTKTTQATKGEMHEGETFGQFVKRRFTNGLIRRGAHEPDGLACVLEARNVAVTGEWTDSPSGFPDLRRLNDARWASDEERTAHMIPLVEALWDWEKWTEKRKVALAKIVAKRVIMEILPPVLRAHGLNEAADRCEKEGTREAALVARDAAAAAWAAVAAAWAADAADAACAAADAANASYAAYAAAYAASAVNAAYAADAAADYAADVAAAEAADAAKTSAPLIHLCRIMIEAAEEAR